MDKQMEEWWNCVHRWFTSMSRCTWWPPSSIIFRQPMHFDWTLFGSCTDFGWPAGSPVSPRPQGRWARGGGGMHHAAPWRKTPRVLSPTLFPTPFPLPNPSPSNPSPTAPAFAGLKTLSSTDASSSTVTIMIWKSHLLDMQDYEPAVWFVGFTLVQNSGCVLRGCKSSEWNLLQCGLFFHFN